MEAITTRVKSVEETLTHILPVCRKIGVTRTSDITFMDRLYIPNFSVVLPGTEDSIWVYSGKGTTSSYAKAGALMEAVERYSSLPKTFPRTFIRGSYRQLSKSYDKVLHPDEVVEPIRTEFSDKESTLDFLPGFDLMTNENVLVPAEIALYRYLPICPVVRAISSSHTNGLASGNVLEEAICHALCEVIERDAVSIADLASSSIPYTSLKKMTDSLEEYLGRPIAGTSIGDKFVDDPSIFPDIDITEIAREFEPVKQLVKRFEDEGITLLVKDLTQGDIGIPTIVASSSEWITHDYGYFAKGFGTHPDVRIALIRAITEVSQTRATNIQGARDDLKKIQYKRNDEIEKRKWQFVPSSGSSAGHQTNNKKIVKLCEMETHRNNDISDDIKLILRGLKKAGLKRAIIIDLTNPHIGIPVVRVIVPGLETFEVTNSVMGRRAKEYFKRLYYS